MVVSRHNERLLFFQQPVLPGFKNAMLSKFFDNEYGGFVSWYAAVTCFVFWFQTANTARKAEGSSSESSVEIFSHSSSDSDYSSHRRPMTSTVSAIPAQRVVTSAFQSIDIIEQQIEERGANIKVTLEEIQELKNRQAWAEQVLNNLLCNSAGKQGVTCTPMQAP